MSYHDPRGDHKPPPFIVLVIIAVLLTLTIYHAFSPRINNDEINLTK